MASKADGEGGTDHFPPFPVEDRPVELRNRRSMATKAPTTKGESGGAGEADEKVGAVVRR